MHETINSETEGQEHQPSLGAGVSEHANCLPSLNLDEWKAGQYGCIVSEIEHLI